MAQKPFLEKVLENGLFASRWLMAPVYVGLLGALVALITVFFQELAREFPRLWSVTNPMDLETSILLALSLIDLSLAANLVLIVIFSGYENFVSKFDLGENEDRPDWMGTVDFSGLKQKLIASIVAISGIALLKAFLEVERAAEFTATDERRVFWQVVVHLTFVASGVLLALMDWLTGHQKPGAPSPPASPKPRDPA